MIFLARPVDENIWHDFRVQETLLDSHNGRLKWNHSSANEHHYCEIYGPPFPFPWFSNFPRFMVNLRYLPKSLISSWLGRFFSLIANQISVMTVSWKSSRTMPLQPGGVKKVEKKWGNHCGIREQNHSQS